MDMTDLQADGAQDTERMTPSRAERPPEPRTDRYSEAVAALMPFADHRFVNGKPCRVGTDDGCTCGYHDALTLVDRAEAAGANAKDAPLREALERIDRDGCQNFYGGQRCWEAGRKRDALYGADKWCDACVARAALTATPAPAALDVEALRQTIRTYRESLPLTMAVGGTQYGPGRMIPSIREDMADDLAAIYARLTARAARDD